MKRIVLLIAVLFISILSYSQVDVSIGNGKVDTLKKLNTTRIQIGSSASDTTNVTGVLLYNGGAFPTASDISNKLDASDTSYNDDYSYSDGVTDMRLFNYAYGEEIFVIYDDPYIYVRSSLSDSNDIVVRSYRLTTGNEQFQFSNTYLIDPTDGNSVSDYTSGTSIHNASDDACPIYTGNVGYVGASHGFTVPVSTTSATHGKDATDEGDVYTDGVRNYYLADIIDGTEIAWKPIEYYSGINWIWDITLGATMTFVSGDGDNQGTIGVDSQTATQQEPILKNYSISYLLNGISEISDGDSTACRYLDIVESYTIPDPRTIPIASPMDWTNGDDWLTFNITYRFQGYGACVVYHDLIVHDSVLINSMGFIQSAKLTIGAYDDILVYSPKTDPIVVGSDTWDLRNIDTLTTNPTSGLNITTSDVDATSNPTDRMVEYLKNDGYDYSSVGFAYGYNLYYPNTDSTFRSNIADNYWNIWTTGKSYPYAINENSTDNTQSDTTFNIIAYRQYIDPERNFTDSATNVYYHKEGNYDMVYIDYHDIVLSDVINLPDYLDNKTISIVESSGVTLTDKIVPTDGINVACSASTGYAVLRLSEGYAPSATAAANTSLWEESGTQIKPISATYQDLLVDDIEATSLELIETTPAYIYKDDNNYVWSNSNGRDYAADRNVIIGENVLYNTTGHTFSVGIGYNSGYASTGTGGIFIGYNTADGYTTGVQNTFIGYTAGMVGTNTGQTNVAVGAAAMYGGTNGDADNNVAIGANAARSLYDGNQNVFIGKDAGYTNQSGSYNVMLGYQAGYNETGSYKLYIDASNTATPLIHGDFTNDSVQVHGEFGYDDNAYGEFSADSLSLTVTISAANTPAAIRPSMDEASFNKNVTLNSSQYQVLVPGIYEWNCNLSFQGATNNDWGLTFYNNAAVASHESQRYSTGNTTGNMSVICLMEMAANDLVDLYIVNKTAANDPTIKSIIITVKKIDKINP